MTFRWYSFANPPPLLVPTVPGLAGVPRCAICDRPVDKVLFAPAVGRQDHFILIAFCHGAQDVMELPRALLEAAPHGQIRWGDAFVPKPKALPAGSP